MKNALSVAKNETFFRLLRSGDADVLTQMTEACDRLGVVVANLCTLYSPSFILLDGIVPAMCPSFFDNVYAAAAGYLCNEYCLLKANYRRDAAAIGSCLLTIEDRLEEYIFASKG